LANAPLSGWDGGDLKVIWVRPQANNSEKQKYFFEKGWTGQISLIRLNKSRSWRNPLRG
jgi:hypothetical protein